MRAKQDVSALALSAFGRYWIIAVLAATVSAIAANMFVGVPLGMVVDVLLAIVLVALALFELYFGVRGIGLLLTGHLPQALLWFGAMVVYLLLVFPPLLAFDAYAYFTGQQIAGGSHLYDWVNDAIATLLKPPAQLISAILVLALNAGSAYVNYVAQARVWLEIGANFLSIIVALQTLAPWRRKGEETAH